MHSTKVTIIEPQQAKLGNNYKNTKLKLLKMNTDIWFNKICKKRQLMPKYINIKVNGKNQHSKNTKTAAINLE
jgi:hypothetical protein